MKPLIITLLLLVLNSCNGQTKEQIKSSSKKTVSIINKKVVDNQINFLDEKYQINGYSISDNLTGYLYPAYSYFDKNIGSFSVNFIGKDKDEQYYWDINNSVSYFSQKGNPYEIASNSKVIKKILDSRKEKYYIIASLLDKKYIGKYDKETEEFDLTKDAKESIYLYQNNKWILLQIIKESEIPENSF